MNKILIVDGKSVLLENLVHKSQEASFSFNGKNYNFRCHKLPDATLLLEHEFSPGVWQRIVGNISQKAKDFRRLQLAGIEAKISEPATSTVPGSAQAELCPTAPMSGMVYKILVKQGDKLKKGQAFTVMEAMKVQTTLVAGEDATVDKILVREGEVISEGAELVRLTAIKGSA